MTDKKRPVGQADGGGIALVIDGFSDRLRQARIKAGFETAADFARHMDKPVPTYLHHENGIRRPKWPQVCHYAQLLKVDVMWLWAGERSTEPAKAGIPVVDWDALGPDGLFQGSMQSHFPAYSKSCIAVRVKDNSQEKIARRGEFIIVDTSVTQLQEDLFFLVYHRSTMKLIKYSEKDGGPTLIFEGTTTKTVSVALADIKVIGRVIQVQRLL